MWTHPPALAPAPQTAPNRPEHPGLRASPSRDTLELLLGDHAIGSPNLGWGEAVCVDYLADSLPAAVPDKALRLLDRAAACNAPKAMTCTVAQALLPAVRARCPQVDEALLWPEVSAFNEAAMRDAADRELNIVDLSEDSIVEAVIARALGDLPAPAYALFAALEVVRAISAASIAIGAADPAYRHVVASASTLAPNIWYGVHMGLGSRQPMTLAQRQHIVRVVAIYDALSPTFRRDVLAVPASLQDDGQMRVRWRLRTQEVLLQAMTPAQVAAGEALKASPEGAELARQLPALHRALEALHQREDLRDELDIHVADAVAAIYEEVRHAGRPEVGPASHAAPPPPAAPAAAPALGRHTQRSPSLPRPAASLWPRVRSRSSSRHSAPEHDAMPPSVG